MIKSFATATLSDVETITGLMRELYEHESLRFDEHAARSALTELLHNASFGAVWLIHDDQAGEAIGYIVVTLCYSLEFGGRFALVDELYVRESERGQGVGRRALQVVEDWCRACGLGAMRLEVAHENTSAFELYRRTGFDRHDRWLMTKRIEM